jgi:cell division protease FtsH
VLDPALLRPGRFDRKVVLELPQRKAREKIFKIHLRDVPVDDDVNLEKLAERTVGFSGADIENLVNEAALLAGRDRKEKVDMRTLTLARDKIVLGSEREDFLSEGEKKLVAYHEGGHAIVAELLEHADPLDKVTVIPRGRALGVTEQIPEEERHNLKFSYLLDRIGVMLGGRAAELEVYNEVTTGAENDIEQATALARRMISQWGMSDELGPVSFKTGEDHVFLGKEMGQPRNFSEYTQRLIDGQIRDLIQEVEQKVRDLIRQHRSELDQLANLLMEQETVTRGEIENIFAQVSQAASAARG